jgi:hypothetical protein
LVFQKRRVFTTLVGWISGSIQAEEWIASRNDDAVFQLVIPESYAGSLEHRLGELQKGFTRPLGLAK